MSSTLPPQVSGLQPQVSSSPSHWDLIIKPKTGWLDLHLADVWRYRDLLWLFVRRDFISVYVQTVLGPLWFFIQPILTTLMFTVIFSGVAKISTDGLPPMLFYLAGTTPWNYFATCLTKTSNTFVLNANIFGKVYFPRLITPLSVVMSTLIQFLIQFVLFLSIWTFYLARGVKIHPDWLLMVALSPCLIVLMGLLGLGLGILISSVTTKYRDFTFLVTFGVQLAMYGTPIIYPMSAIPQKYRLLIELNPMSAIVESFRSIFLGGPIPWHALGCSTAITFVILLCGMIIFNKIEKTFMDTV